MRFRGGRGLALVSSMLLAAAAPSSPAAPLATYRGGEVTAEEYAGWLAAENRNDDPAQRTVYLESIALAETLERSALLAGMEADAEVRFRLQEAERGILVQAFQRRENEAAQPTEAEVEAELEAEKGELAKPRRVRLRNVFKKVPATATPDERAAARRDMEDVRRRLGAGADFSEVALRESDSQTRYQGGAMGAVPPGALQPEVERIAFGLREGELSPIIETPDGFTLLRCDGIIEARVMPLDEARHRIRQGLFTRRSEARLRALREELLRAASVQETFQAAWAAGRDEAVAARFTAGTVTVAELRWLTGGRLEPTSRDALRAALEEHVFRVKLAERTRQQGLDADSVVQSRVRWAKARVLATFEMTRRVGRILTRPTEAEMRAHFEANRNRYQHPAELDFSVIELPPESAGSERERLEQAEALAAQLRSGQRDFVEAARSLSRHASAPNGGRLGWLTVRQAAVFGPGIFRALGLLTPGQVSSPVQQDGTLWVLKLGDRRPARPLTFAEALTRIENELSNARVAEIQERLEAEARLALDLRVHPPATAP
jgi:peptidyl-prolyl cis-trans isomerase C